MAFKNIICFGVLTYITASRALLTGLDLALIHTREALSLM